MISMILFLIFMSITPVCFIKYIESEKNSEKQKKFGYFAAAAFGGAVLSEICGSWFGAVGLLLTGCVMYLVMLLCRFVRKKINGSDDTKAVSFFTKGFYRYLIIAIFFLLTAAGVLSHIYDGIAEVGLTYQLSQDNYCLALWWVPSVAFAVIISGMLVSDNVGKYGKMLTGCIVVSALMVMVIGDMSTIVFGGSITQVIVVIEETIVSDGYPQNVSTALYIIMRLSSLYVACLAVGGVVAFVVTLVKQMRNKKVLSEDKTPIVSVEQMRKSDAYTIEQGVSGQELMHRAAEGIFASAEWEDKKIAIIAGSGNNGGDGYALASILAEKGIFAHIYRTSERFSADGKFYYEQAKEKGVTDEMFTAHTDLNGYDMIVDCILGTGFKGVPEDVTADAINAINNSGAYVISADINSGMNGDTGEAILAVKSDITVSVGFYKKGMFSENAEELIGKLVNVDIGIVLV